MIDDVTDQRTANKALIAKQFISVIPHAKALGMEVTTIGDGVAEITMPYDDCLIGDPETGVIHGGAVSTLMIPAAEPP